MRASYVVGVFVCSLVVLCVLFHVLPAGLFLGVGVVPAVLVIAGVTAIVLAREPYQDRAKRGCMLGTATGLALAIGYTTGREVWEGFHPLAPAMQAFNGYRPWTLVALQALLSLVPLGCVTGALFGRARRDQSTWQRVWLMIAVPAVFLLAAVGLAEVASIMSLRGG